MKYKKVLFMMLLTCMFLGAYAQTNRIYIPDITMSRGGEGTLSVFMDNVDEITAVEFTMELSTGFTINLVSAIPTERAQNHQVTVRRLNNGKYKFVVMSALNAPIEGIAGKIFTFQIATTDELVSSTNYPLVISNAVMSKKTGENVLQEFNAGVISIKSMPNLHVVSVECSEPVADSDLTVTWKVQNDGQGSTENAQWKDYVWLVPNISFGTVGWGGYTTILLATVDNIMSLSAGESYENSVVVHIDQKCFGAYDLVVTSDMYNIYDIDFSSVDGLPPYPYSPEEGEYGYFMGTTDSNYNLVQEEGETSGESDNFFYKRIDIGVPLLPDLQVTKVTAEVIPLGYCTTQMIEDIEATIPTPLTAAGVAHNSVFYSGKKVKVKATITNKGDLAITKGSWKNALYVSNSADINEGELIGLSLITVEDVTLQPNGSTTVTFTTYLPYELYGNVYFHVYADTDDEVYEMANIQNNWGCSSVYNVLLTPGADFVPHNLIVPTKISSGLPFDVSYKVKNNGSGIPYYLSWKDNVYLSTSQEGLDNNAILLETFNQVGFWNAPPLPVSLGTAGSGVIYRPAEDYHFEGDNYSASRNVKADGIAPGTYYVYVKVDANDQIFEYNGEDNNVICSGAVQVVYPDLSVELLTVSEDTLITGNNVAISWKLRNIGAGDIQNANIKDYIYASPNINGTGLIKIGEVSNNVSIVSGGEKILKCNIKIPESELLNGQLYLFVKTNIDPLTGVDERNLSNNLSIGMQREFQYVSSTSPSTPVIKGMNIVVADLTAPSQVLPGQHIQVSYKVINNGDMVVNKNVIHEIYLSNSYYFDSSSSTKCTILENPQSIEGLAPDENMPFSIEVTIPSDIKGGTKYLHVILNRDNQLSEVNKGDNTTFTYFFMNGNIPDLTISNMNVPSAIWTSTPTEVSWTLENSGNWEASNVVCNLYLSKNNTYEWGDVKLATINVSKLAANSSSTLKSTINLNDSDIGSYYLIVRVNENNVIEESNTNNNVATTAFVAKQSLLPDLAISDLEIEGELRPGASVTVRAKVQNVGDSITRKDKWSDSFYLSTDYALNTRNAINIGNKAHVGVLNEGGSYIITATLNIPTDVHGYYFLYAETDGSDAIYEKQEDNNIMKTTVS